MEQACAKARSSVAITREPAESKAVSSRKIKSTKPARQAIVSSAISSSDLPIQLSSISNYDKYSKSSNHMDREPLPGRELHARFHPLDPILHGP